MSNFNHGDKVIYKGKDREFIKNGDVVFFDQISRKPGGKHCFIQCIGSNYRGAQVLISDLEEIVEVEDNQSEQHKADIAEAREVGNPRWVAFVEHFGKQPMYEYLAFIARMCALYAESKGQPSDTLNRPPIVDHDEFTEFINENATKWTGLPTIGRGLEA